MKKLIIIGAGAVGGFLAYNHEHFKKEYELIGFLDDDERKIGKLSFGYKVLGTIDDAAKYVDCYFLLGIAFPNAKKTIVQNVSHLNLNFINYISPHAWISDGVKIGRGVIIYPNASVDFEVEIHDYVTVNNNCVVGHNSILNDYTTLAPCVGLAGYTQCLDGSDVGIGAKTRQGVIIGKGAIVGGQAMVVEDVPENTVVAGVPAKVLRVKGQ